MTTQPEQILENNLVKQLTSLEYAYVHINNEDGILANLKGQLEQFNHTTFSEKEFGAILNHLAKGTIFEKSKTLRDRFQLNRDNGVNTKYYANNRYQSFQQTFFWADINNRNITDLTNFAAAFLNRDHLGKRTTKDLFGDCLHKYVITDAIRDQNVLKFNIEYIGRYRQISNTFIDIEVEDIDTREVIDSPERLEKIVDYIIRYHNQKTHNREYTAIFAVSSIDNLIKYYELFKKKKEEGEHDLRIATIFSYGINEDDSDATGMLPDDYAMAAEPLFVYNTSHSREKLDEFIADYNAMYNTGFSTKDSRQYENYFKDISKRELIEKFIEENLPLIDDVDAIPDEFEKFWNDQKLLALGKICEEEHLDQKQFQALIDAYIYSEQEPLRDEVFKCLDNRPSVLKAREIGERIIAKMKAFIDVFVRGVAA